jgi:N-acetylglucosaminyldiphosphoundecaprenol N-acetyl-beta-D-mannosaminyltransferase
MKPVRLLNGWFHPFTLGQTVDAAMDLVESNRRGYLCTVNVAILMTMRGDAWLKRFVDRAAITVADGVPLVWASRALRRPVPERVAGVELVTSICESAAARGFPVYLLGARREVVESLAARLREQFPALELAGYDDGYFGAEEAGARAEAIAASGARVLFVAMGMPRQERFIEEWWERLGVDFAIGVGGSFDVLAGLRKRAPALVQKIGFEWAYRLVQEPRRLFTRYLVTNSQFLYCFAREVFGLGGRDADRDLTDPDR